jgi:ATP-dependent RNA helicase RhlE
VNFEIFNFNQSIMDNIKAQGYTEPTPIQNKAMPPVLEGHDLIGLAQTGTGKTAAFTLPILQKLMNFPRSTVRALILSPTRELAEQTCTVINQLAFKTGLRCISIYGGVGMDQQIRGLRSGNEIVVACPGRLLDHIWKGTINLSHIEVLVIDEADRMFDMGFLPDIKNILKCLTGKKQTLLFSATMPDDITNLVKSTLINPVTIQIGHKAPAATISHALYPVKQHLKTALLMEVLHNTDTESVLIFTRTKHRTERILSQLIRAGFKATSLQGNLSQNRRSAAIDGFRSRKYKIMVATDIAARGIDVLSISHVINYDMPESADAYTHRVGRTGRSDKKGDALTFVTDDDKVMIAEIERILKAKLERKLLPGFNYQASSSIQSPAVQRPRKPMSRQNISYNLRRSHPVHS